MFRIAVVAFALVAASCTNATIGDPPPTGNPLVLTQHDATTIKGTFAHGGSVIAFDSELVGADHATLRLEIDGTVLTADADVVNARFTEDGQLGALYREDLDALVALRDALVANDATIVTSTHGKLLVKEADHLAEAPVGHTFDRVEVAMPAVAIVDRSASCGDDGVSCLPGEDGYAWSYHTASYHPCYAFWEQYGNSAPDCEGRCGAGCSWWDHDYTQDCFDHDWCLNFHGGSSFSDNPDCGDEYNNAYDDWWATFGSYC